jgi:hypothetical protein
LSVIAFFEPVLNDTFKEMNKERCNMHGDKR